MTMSSCVYVFSAISLALLTACNSAAVESEIRASVRAQSDNLPRRDLQNVANFIAYGGSIEYSTHIFPGEERPSPVRAVAIVNNRIRIGNIGSTADSTIKPRGYNQLRIGWEKCHLITNLLGGSGKDARNLFACPRLINVLVMNHYEAKLRNYLNDNPQALVRYEVSLSYVRSFDYPRFIGMKATVPGTTLFNVYFPNSVSTSTFIAVCYDGVLTQSNAVPKKLRRYRLNVKC